tara:strand:+ start:227 stop:538 length:312 start_codon:yes stop_codon:yes gene_type:complete
MSWEEYYFQGEELWQDLNNPDDWEGREAEYCIAMTEYASNYADDACNYDEDSDDEVCNHPSETQGSDGAYRCDLCNAITHDISDEEFAHQNGGNFANSDWQGW